MCLICIEFNKSKLSLKEAFLNLCEMEESLSKEHYEEVFEMLNKAIEEDQLSKDSNEYDYYNKVTEEDWMDFWYRSADYWGDYPGDIGED